MSFNLQLFSSIFILVILFTIIYIVRKDKISVKYALVWLFAGVILFIFVLFPSIMNFISTLLGFEVGSNMIFAGLIAMLIFINIALTVIVSGQSSKIRLLIQEVSMLKGKIDEKR